MNDKWRVSFAEALFWFFGNFIYGLVPLAVVMIYSENKCIQFLNDGYLVFLAAALAGSIGIDTFLLRQKINGFISAFINTFGYAAIMYTSVLYVAQTESQSGFNDMPLFQTFMILFYILFCIFIKTYINYEQCDDRTY